MQVELDVYLLWQEKTATGGYSVEQKLTEEGRMYMKLEIPVVCAPIIIC